MKNKRLKVELIAMGGIAFITYILHTFVNNPYVAVNTLIGLSIPVLTLELFYSLFIDE